MVMIVKDHEKQAHGFISVTRLPWHPRRPAQWQAEAKALAPSGVAARIADARSIVPNERWLASRAENSSGVGKFGRAASKSLGLG